MLPNYHIIQVKAMPYNDNVGFYRIRVTSERFKQHAYIPYTNEPGVAPLALDSAVAFLKGKGFKIIGTGEGKDHYYLISDTFEPIK